MTDSNSRIQKQAEDRPVDDTRTLDLWSPAGDTVTIKVANVPVVKPTIPPEVKARLDAFLEPITPKPGEIAIVGNLAGVRDRFNVAEREIFGAILDEILIPEHTTWGHGFCEVTVRTPPSENCELVDRIERLARERRSNSYLVNIGPKSPIYEWLLWIEGFARRCQLRVTVYTAGKVPAMFHHRAIAVGERGLRRLSDGAYLRFTDMRQIAASFSKEDVEARCRQEREIADALFETHLKAAERVLGPVAPGTREIMRKLFDLLGLPNG
jgi:hypothetical protein